MSAQADKVCTSIIGWSKSGECFRTLIDYERKTSQGFYIVDRRWTGIKSCNCRKRRFYPRMTSLTFKRIEQGGFFATNVGSCSSMNSQIESFPLAEGIFSENSIRV